MTTAAATAVGGAWPIAAAGVAALLVLGAVTYVLGRQLRELRASIEGLDRRLTDVSARLEDGHRRLIESSDSAQRQVTTLGKTSEAARRELEARHDRLESNIERTLRAEYEQLEQLLALYRELDGTPGLPHLRHWAASPDFQRLLYRTIRERRPMAVLECGSGTTTLIADIALGHTGQGHVTSLEHEPHFADATRELLRTWEAGERATVVDAPLRSYDLGDRQFRWYDLEGVDVDEIDVLVVDGPPGNLQEQSRYPALPLLADRLAPEAMILLDDVVRPDERAIIDRWKHEFEPVGVEILAFDKGAGVLSWRLSPS